MDICTSYDYLSTVIVFALILVPFTLAGSAKDKWRSGDIIAMLGM